MFSESGRQLAPQLPIPEILESNDKVPPRYCPWLSRCRSGNFWSYPSGTVRGIPTDKFEILEKLVNLQPKSADDSNSKFDALLR